MADRPEDTAYLRAELAPTCLPARCRTSLEARFSERGWEHAWAASSAQPWVSDSSWLCD